MKRTNREKARRTSPPVPASAPGEESGAGHLWAAMFLALSTFLAYAVALKGTWAFDDSAIGQFAGVETVLNLRLGYRKIAYLSFLVNRWIDPVSPVSYRVVNIFIHICNSFLVYAVAFRTLMLPAWKEKYGSYAFGVSFISSAVFALHPLNINAVSYIVQRMTSLSLMFVLLALLSYITARTSPGRFKAVLLYAATLLFVLCGIFSKENAVMAVPLIVLYDAAFLFELRRKGYWVSMVAVLVLGLSALAAASVFLHFDKAILGLGDILLHPQRQIPDLGWTALDVYWTPAGHILTEFRVVGRYLFLLFFPLPGFLVFDWWGYPLSTGVLSPLTTLISFLVIAALISFAVIKFRELPFLSFGILWYFIAVALESFIALGSDLYFEHRNYMPLAGLAFGITGQAVAFSAVKPQKKTVWAIACVVSLLLGGLTFQRNLVWKDSISLWKDTVEKTTGNLRAMIAVGNSYLKTSDLNSAKKYYADALKVGAVDKRPHLFEDAAYSLGMVSLFTGDLPQAGKVIAFMDAKIEGSARLAILKGFYRSQEGNLEGAILQYKGILPVVFGRDRVIVYTLLGEAYFRKGSFENAIASYKKAVELDPSFAAAYHGLGAVYMSRNDLERAVLFIEKALSLDPQNALALADMADLILTKKEPPEKAEKFALRAFTSAPGAPTPYLAMGSVLIVKGKPEAAEELFKKAAERGAKNYMIPFSKARAYLLKGDREKVKALLAEVLSIKDTPEDLRRSLSISLKSM